MLNTKNFVKFIFMCGLISIIFSCSSAVKMPKNYIEKPMNVVLFIREEYHWDFIDGYRQRTGGIIGKTIVAAMDADMKSKYESRIKEIFNNFTPKVRPFILEKLKGEFPNYNFILINEEERNSYTKEKFPLLMEKYKADSYLYLNTKISIIRSETKKGLFGWDYYVEGQIYGIMYDYLEQKIKGKEYIIWKNHFSYQAEWEYPVKDLSLYVTDDVIFPLLDKCLNGIGNKLISNMKGSDK